MIIWKPKNNIIKILNIFSIKIYNIMFGISFLLGNLIIKYIYKKENLKKKTFNNLNNYIIFGIIIGARLGQIIFYDLSYYYNNKKWLEAILPITIKNNIKNCNILDCIKNIQFTGYNGLSSHGATIGLLISIFLYKKKFLKKKNILYIYDIMCIPMNLGASLIRIGNLFNSEIIGKSSTLPWSFKFINIKNNHIYRHPTQLYESLTYLIIFIFLFYIYKKKKHKKGFIFSLFLMITWTSRFIIEFIKEPQGKEIIKIFNLNTGQVLSIPFILTGLIIFLLKK